MKQSLLTEINYLIQYYGSKEAVMLIGNNKRSIRFGRILRILFFRYNEVIL